MVSCKTSIASFINVALCPPGKPNESSRLTAITCYTEAVETARNLFRYYAHPICLVASCIALTIVVLCHVFIPKLRDLQGKCLLSHVCSLLTGNIALLSATLWHSYSNWLCVAIGKREGPGQCPCFVSEF